jgi:hypothetical protein
MRIVVSDPAAELIGERGGRLYVWPRRALCCGAVTRLTAASEPRPDTAFRRVDGGNDVELYVPEGLNPLPEELHLEVRRFPRRIEAYWNGCAWVA